MANEQAGEKQVAADTDVDADVFAGRARIGADRRELQRIEAHLGHRIRLPFKDRDVHGPATLVGFDPPLERHRHERRFALHRVDAEGEAAVLTNLLRPRHHV
jgi:hypothetical protein